MNTLFIAAFGWLVPGGSYLLLRRYRQFALSAAVVLAAFAAGLALHGGCSWPRPEELAGIDGFTALAFKTGAFGKLLAGLPYLLAQYFDRSTFLASRLQDQGAALLMMAGLANAFSIGSALDLRKEHAK